MASEPKNSQLARLIVKHGPISGTDLAAKAAAAGMNCPTKNVQGILGGHLTRGEIILRKRDSANWYMTANQAADWDAAADGAAADGAAADGAAADAVAHVMSAPPVAKQTKTEIPVSETAADSGEIAALKSQVHGLLNDVAAANLIFSQIADTLKVKRPEHIPAALDELTQALATRAMQPAKEAGKLALLLIDSAELTEIEELDADDDAQAMAMTNIELGHAARVLVVRIMGEAKRQAKWKEAA